MSDTWKGSSSTDWFTGTNWSTAAKPTISATGTQNVTISGTATNQPLIYALAPGASTITVNQNVVTSGVTYTSLTETQIGGEQITLTGGANLTVLGVAMGIFYGNTSDTLTATRGTLTGLHGALSSTPSYDSHMQISAIGTDTLTVEGIDENFGVLSASGTGNTLVINNAATGYNQALHGLINYGLITISSGAEVIINSTSSSSSSGTVSNFYNAGWIVDNGGTLKIDSTVLDGANTASSATGIDGYILIENAGNVFLGNTVAAHEEVVFADTTANTLQITAGTLFAGTVANFGATDTIIVNGFTGTSNATLVTVGGVNELLTTNGSVVTTITLAGSISTEITTGTNASGQEFIQAGATSFSGNSSTLGNAGTTTTTITQSSNITLSGSATTLTVYDSLAGTGALTIANGATLALDNPSGTDAGQSVVFSTLGSAANPNTLILNGSTAGFAGTITGFTGNDVIDLGASVLPTLASGAGVALSYANGVLSVTETSATGGALSSTQLTLAGTAAGVLSASSFVALEASSGVEVELASNMSGQGFVFSLASGSGNFETPADFTGGVAPGNIIAAGETVTIAVGTAAVSGVTDNGTIAVTSTFTDTTALTGTGTLAVAAGGSATLTGGATLGSITDAGRLTLGGNDAAAISLASGAQVTLASNFSDTSAITGAGTLTVNTGVTATLAAGSSLASILDSGTLNLAGSLGGSINMEGNGAGSVADFSGTDTTSHVLNTALTNFGTGDDIILGAGNFSLSGTSDKLSETYSNGTLVVTDTTDGASVSLAVGLTSGDLASWLTVSGASGQLDIHLCFYPGTALATPEGEIAVEDLRAGDLVATANGPMPVRWVGHSHISTRFADPLRALPIRITAGALGAGLPKRDLLLSPDHAVFLGGILAQAGALVNGVNIIRETNVPETFTYYHVELETHELLMAEGVAAESFVDNVERMHFHNWDDRVAPATPIEEMPYPRAKAQRQLPQALRNLLAARKVA